MAFFPAPKVTRAMLEYPTYNVSFAYLAAINKVLYSSQATYAAQIVTRDAFTDRAIVGDTNPHDAVETGARVQNPGNFYGSQLMTSNSTADHKLFKVSGGSYTCIATESVDIDSRGEALATSCSGSTIKSLRWDAYSAIRDPLKLGTATATLSATDTSYASGYFGFRPIRETTYHGAMDSASAYLLLPLTPLPPALAIVEVEVEKGEERGILTYGPALERELVEVEQLQGLPQHLYLEAKRYRILRSKGFTDEEIELVFGYVPQHQVDLASVTWGAFEFSPDSPTNIIVITGDNPYRQGAVERQVQRARRKNLKALKPPKSYEEAVEMYKQLSRDFKHWLAGKDNFAYQVLGHEWLEPMAVADFYYGELVEHRTHYSQIKQVSDQELWFILGFWEARLDAHKDKMPGDEYEVHKRKFVEIKKRGW